MGYFLELREGLTSVLGSTHVVEQLTGSMFLSNLTLDFDLILGGSTLLLYSRYSLSVPE